MTTTTTTTSRILDELLALGQNVDLTASNSASIQQPNVTIIDYRQPEQSTDAGPPFAAAPWQPHPRPRETVTTFDEFTNQFKSTNDGGESSSSSKNTLTPLTSTSIHPLAVAAASNVKILDIRRTKTDRRRRKPRAGSGDQYENLPPIYVSDDGDEFEADDEGAQQSDQPEHSEQQR